MTFPFGPDHTDADELNALLDAMRPGGRVPEPSSEEPGELARAARQFRGLADRAAGVAPAPERTFDAIWEEMMSAHGAMALTPEEAGPVTRLDDATYRVQPVPEVPRAGWLQSLASAAILVVVVAGMIAAAWSLRDSNGGGPSGPGDEIRRAAPGLDAGTPNATAENEVNYYSYPDPRTCNATIVLTPSERAALSSENRDWSREEFGPVSHPEANDARSAALVARESIACERYIIPESLMTDHMLWLYWQLAGSPGYPEFAKKRQALERQVSSYLTDIAPSDIFHLTDEVPTGGQSQNPFTFVPETAVQFPDGRIGIPASFLIPFNDPSWRQEPPSALMTEFDVLKNESGEWLVDEQLTVCIGECADYISGGAQPFFDLRVNPDLETPVVRSAATAAPVSNPADDAQWTDWITAAECVPAEAGEMWAVTDTRAYTLVGPANPDDAEAAAKAARMEEACRFSTSRRPLDDYSFVASRDESFSDRAIRQQAAGKAIADLYPIADASDYFVFTDEVPGDSGNANRVFEPRHAIALEDGRIIIPGTWLIWTGDPSFIQQAPENFITQAVVMQQIADGTWVVTDNLPICLGECDGIWPEISPFNSEYSSIRVPGGALASPEASPVAKTDWTAWITPQECRIEPMSDEEYAEIMRTEMSVPGRGYTIAGTPDPVDADAAASVAREHEQCATDGKTMQKRALESPYYVHITNGGFVTGDTPQERRINQIHHSQALSAQWPVQDPEQFILVSGDADFRARAFAGFTYLPENAVLLDDGRIAIPGTKLFANEPEDPDLVTFVLILTDESGEWRVDESLSLCVGDCDAYWGEVWGMAPAPSASPSATPEG